MSDFSDGWPKADRSLFPLEESLWHNACGKELKCNWAFMLGITEFECTECKATWTLAAMHALSDAEFNYSFHVRPAGYDEWALVWEVNPVTKTRNTKLVRAAEAAALERVKF